MNTLVEVIQKTGIFLIAAQALIHFAPGTSYAKYMKLLMGIMVLLLFLSPVYHVVTGDILSWIEMPDDRGMNTGQIRTPELTMSWTEMESYIENHSWKQETVMSQMEEEIKSRLNDEINRILREGNLDFQENTEYSVTSVTINETDPVSMRIGIYGKNTANRMEGNSVIHISDIVIGEDRQDAESDMQNNITGGIKNVVNENKQLSTFFGQRFADILGVEPDQVEVIVYGVDQ